MTDSEKILDLAFELENVCDDIESYNNSDFEDQIYAHSLENAKISLIQKSYELTHGASHNIIYISF